MNGLTVREQPKTYPVHSWQSCNIKDTVVKTDLLLHLSQCSFYCAAAEARPPLYYAYMVSDERNSVDDLTLRFRQILDSSPALLHTGRPDGYLDFFNRTWCEFVGKPAEALHGWG